MSSKNGVVSGRGRRFALACFFRCARRETIRRRRASWCLPFVFLTLCLAQAAYAQEAPPGCVDDPSGGSCPGDMTGDMGDGSDPAISGDPSSGGSSSGDGESQKSIDKRFKAFSSIVLSDYIQNIGTQLVPHIPDIQPIIDPYSGQPLRFVHGNGLFPSLQGSATPQISSLVAHTEPVAGDGEFVVDETDLSLPGEGVPFVFSRHYRSGVEYQTPLGFGWNHTFNQHLVVFDLPQTFSPTPGISEIFLINDRLEQIRFVIQNTVDGYDHYAAAAPSPLLLTHSHNNASATWQLQDGTNLVRVFDGTGRDLIRIQDYAGHALTINWSTTPPAGIVWNAFKPKVVSVVDTTGRTIFFNYKIVKAQDMDFHPLDLMGSDAIPDRSGLLLANGPADTGGEFLECLSLTTDCATPLVSFSVSFRLAYKTEPPYTHEAIEAQDSPLPPLVTHQYFANWFYEFDLASAHDSKGYGPSYKYLTLPDRTTGSDRAYQKNFVEYWPTRIARGYFAYLRAHIPDLQTQCADVFAYSVIYGGFTTDPNQDYTKLIKKICIDPMPAAVAALSKKILTSYTVFGLPPQIMHDLVEVDDADGKPIVQNTFGMNTTFADFNRVNKQVLGNNPANTTTFSYLDYVLQPPINLPAFQPIDICPVSGNGYGPPLTATNKESDASQPLALRLIRNGPAGRTFISYYDAAGRLLRDVDGTGHPTDYNYGAFGRTGVLLSTGRRTCTSYDANGMPAEITSLPAPAKPGPVLTITIGHDANQQVMSIVKAAVGAEQSNREIERDSWERIVGVGDAVDAQHRNWTCFTYTDVPINLTPILIAHGATEHTRAASVALDLPFPAPGSFRRPPCLNPKEILPTYRAALPSLIVRPDGSQIQLRGLTPTGPSDVLVDATGPSPLDRYYTFDGFGHVNGTGLRDVATQKVIPASVESWTTDLEGLVETHNVANQAAPGLTVETTYAYDHSWRLQRVISPLGSVTYARDGLGRVTSVTETPNGAVGASGAPRTACTRYDAFGAISETISPEGIVTDYDYNGAGQLLDVTIGPVAYLPTIFGTPYAPCTPQIGPIVAGKAPVRETVQSFGYALNGQLSSYTTDGTSRFYDYDGQDRLVDISVSDKKIVGANGKPQTLFRHLARGYDGFNLAWSAVLDAYPASGQLPAFLSPSVHAATEYRLDELNRPTEIRQWQFVETPTPVAEPQPYGITTFSYDDAKGLSDVQGPDLATSEIHRDGVGRPTQLTLAKGEPTQVQTAISYSNAGLAVQAVTSPSVVPGGSMTESGTMAPNGQWLERNVQGVVIVRNQLDPFGRVLIQRTPDNTAQKLSYDAFGDVISVQQYLAADSAIQIAALGWNRDGAPTTATDGAGHLTTSAYDTAGRLRTLASGLGTVTYSYVPGTELVATIAGPGAVTTLSYDIGGKLIVEAVADAPGRVASGSQSFGYDALGEMNSASVVRPGSASAEAVSLLHDSTGRQISETNSVSGALVQHMFGVRSDLLTVTVAGNSINVERDLDALDRIVSLKLGSVSEATYAYAGLDLASVAYGNGLTQAVHYDALGHVVLETVTGPNATVMTLSRGYGLDAIPHRSDLVVGGSMAETGFYRTDAAGRVQTEESFRPGLASSDTVASNAISGAHFDAAARVYALDGAGNWLSRSGPNGLTANTDSANRYNLLNGAPISNVAGGGPGRLLGVDYGWDGLNELRSARTSGQTATWSYDALGRATQESDAPGGATFLLWDANTFLGRMTAGDAGSLRVAVAAAGEPPVALAQAGTVTSYLHTDADSSVFGVTDPSGALVQGIAYSAYGEPRIFGSNGELATDKPASPLLFQGAQYYPDFDIYRMGARIYQPGVGRFLEPDPIGQIGGLNLFAFVEDRPLLESDPSGLKGRPGSAAIDPDAGSEGSWLSFLDSHSFDQARNAADAYASSTNPFGQALALVNSGIFFAAGLIDRPLNAVNQGIDDFADSIDRRGAVRNAVKSGIEDFGNGMLGVSLPIFEVPVSPQVVALEGGAEARLVQNLAPEAEFATAMRDDALADNAVRSPVPASWVAGEGAGACFAANGPCAQGPRGARGLLQKEGLKINNGRCVYCGAKATTLDHVWPWIFGGPTELWNLVPACGSCNPSKGALELGFWLLKKGKVRFGP